MIDLCDFPRPDPRIPKEDYRALAKAIALDSINYSAPVVLKKRDIYAILNEING